MYLYLDNRFLVLLSLGFHSELTKSESNSSLKDCNLENQFVILIL